MTNAKTNIKAKKNTKTNPAAVVETVKIDPTEGSEHLDITDNNPVTFAQSGLGNAPLYKERRGRVQMVVWAREDKNGTMRFSVSLKRSYKTEQGFGETSSLDRRDLADAAGLLTHIQAILPDEWSTKIADAAS